MALWGDAKLIFCILFIACCTVSQAEMAMDCCLQVKDKPIDKRAVANYRQQVGGQGCDIDATIFVTRRGKELCAPARGPWISDLMKHVDHLKRVCKRLNYKGNRCFGVKPEKN